MGLLRAGAVLPRSDLQELGETERAREHYRIFVEWWETADPELQPWVEEGRAALARLRVS